MQRQFDSILARLAALEPSIGERPVLLAVSGGIDSMCMAELFLHSLSFVRFSVAHCNFHLRGEESDSDEALVARWAADKGIRLHKADFDTVAFARENGLSIEMAARQLRYRWFSDVASEYGCSAVAVAHNANDNAETMVLNLLRGTGIKGVTGMKEVSCVPYSDDRVLLVRPLLHFTRSQIEGYVRARGIEYHDDRTNAEVEYKRNKVRNLVFPVFREINPSFVKAFNRDMEYFSQVESIADGYFSGHCRQMLLPSDGKSEIRISKDRLMSDPQWKYMLYRFLDRYGFNSSAVHSVCRILEEADTVGGKTFVSGDFELLLSSREITVRKIPAKADSPVPAGRMDVLSASDPVMVVRSAGDYFFNGVSFSVSAMKWDGSMSVKQPEGTIVFDRSRLDFPFICRRWLPGDWIRPLGLKGRKKISDLFTDLKYGQPEKEAAVMIVRPPVVNAGVVNAGAVDASAVNTSAVNASAVNTNAVNTSAVNTSAVNTSAVNTNAVDASAAGASAADTPADDAPEHHLSAVLGVRIDDSIRITSRTEDIIMIKVKDQ